MKEADDVTTDHSTNTFNDRKHQTRENIASVFLHFGFIKLQKDLPIKIVCFMVMINHTADYFSSLITIKIHY